MDPKAKTNTTAPKAPRKARTPRALDPVQTQLIEEGKAALVTARERQKEAIALSKVISCIGTLSDWGLSHVHDAYSKRREVLHQPESAST